MGFFSDDKYQDRAWDWAKDMSRLTYPGWNEMYQQNLGASTSGNLTPGNQRTFDFAKNSLAPFTAQGGGVEDTDIWNTLKGLYTGYEGPVDPFSTDLFKGAENLYEKDALYGHLMDPLKRGIEGQFGNRVNTLLSSGASGGALIDALANAAMSRDTAIGDMERNLRSQDILRGDQRSMALTDLAKSIYGTQEAGRLNRAGTLANAGMGLNQQGLMTQLSLTDLLSRLQQNQSERALGMANTGIQGRYLTGQNLAAGEGSQNTGIFSSLMQMGSMLGMGLGQSGMGGGGGGAASTPYIPAM